MSSENKPCSKTMQNLIAKVITPTTPTPSVVSKKPKPLTQEVIDYLDKFPITNLHRLVDDYNRKIKNYHAGNELFKGITESLLSTPEIAAQLTLSAEPNWRGYFGLQFKSKLNEESFDYHVSKKYLLLHDRAKQKNFNFDLTITDIKRLLKLKRCYYTNVVLTDNDPNLSTHRTIDRVDNKKGYTKDNVVVCSMQINQLKSNLFESPNSVTAVDAELLYKFVSKFLNK